VAAAMSAKLAEAVKALRAGGVVAYPTEAVFGLGCLPDDEDALQRLCVLKGRDPELGMIVIGSDFDQLRPLLGDLDPQIESRILASWPGNTTWVLPAATELHPLVTGGRATVAVRVPGTALARELCRELGSPITSTSANRHGEPAARDAAAVAAILGDEIDCLIDGMTDGAAAPSEIRDGLTGVTLRSGGAE
jgi:L-threonylcarbamoyladenylate synthase